MKVKTNIKIKPRNIVKVAVRMVSGGAASYVTRTIANKAIAEEELTAYDQVQVNIGVASIGIATGHIVGKEADELIDIAFDAAGHARKIKVNVEEPEVIDHEECK